MEKQTAGYEEAEACGIDISLIRANLRLTPLERLRQHDRTATMEKLRKTMAKKRG